MTPTFTDADRERLTTLRDEWARLVHPDKLGMSENLIGPFPCACAGCRRARANRDALSSALLALARGEQMEQVLSLGVVKVRDDQRQTLGALYPADPGAFDPGEAASTCGACLYPQVFSPTCTRPKGHDGLHVAHGTRGEAIYVWLAAPGLPSGERGVDG